MFTVELIERAHSKVKSGADFPDYIHEIKQLGVISFETWVIDSHTLYFGNDSYQAKSEPMYESLIINDKSDRMKFIHYLEIHQQGQTDYLSFCKDCAETGILKWFVNLNELTCTYYDKAENTILVEHIPG